MHAVFTLSQVPPAVTLKIERESDVLTRRQVAWRLIDLDALGTDVVRLDAGTSITSTAAACA